MLRVWICENFWVSLLVFSPFFSLSMFSAFLGQLKDVVLYMMGSIPVFLEYVIFQWQSHSAPKPERLVIFVTVFRNVIFMALTTP